MSETGLLPLYALVTVVSFVNSLKKGEEELVRTERPKSHMGSPGRH